MLEHHCAQLRHALGHAAVRAKVVQAWGAKGDAHHHARLHVRIQHHRAFVACRYREGGGGWELASGTQLCRWVAAVGSQPTHRLEAPGCHAYCTCRPQLAALSTHVHAPVRKPSEVER